ncbi:MAG: hypothetical protein V1702_00615 [Candidatus Woesearchaeota archaeon]
MAFTFQFELNSGMFVPLVILITLLLLFIRQGYKYRDTRYLFIGFLCMTASAFFAFIQPTEITTSQTAGLISHIFAGATGWLLWLDAKRILEIQEVKQ